MKLLDLCTKAKINCPEHLTNLDVKGITSNSKEVKDGYIFFCLEGTKLDGHRYIDDALMRGACCAVIENEKYACERALIVPSTRVALANMMNVFCGEPTKKLKFIGVTGTNGKTSVTEMLKNILTHAKIPCSTIGTLNSSSFSPNSMCGAANFTTPDPEELYPKLQRISDAGAKFVIMETSSHALKLEKLAPIDFEIGIFTNLTEDHLDFHHTLEDYFKSKLRLFNKCKIGIINVDDASGKIISKLAPCKIKTCSTEQNADFLAVDIKNLCESGTEYTVKHKDSKMRISCNVPGQFSIMNSMQACAAALVLGVDIKIIESSFKDFWGVAGRLEKVQLPPECEFLVYIDYAHTPDALQKLLETVNGFKSGERRVVLLFGCGGDREQEKRKIMGKIATRMADFTVVTSDNPRSESPLDIINQILWGIDESASFAVIPERKRAIEYVIATAQRGDIIVLAGKGHEKYEINESGKHPFDEREVIREAIKNYYERKK